MRILQDENWKVLRFLDEKWQRKKQAAKKIYKFQKQFSCRGVDGRFSCVEVFFQVHSIQSLPPQ